MTPGEYLESIKHRLITDDSVSRYEIIREQFTSLNAQIRVRLTFSDDSHLEFSEFLRSNRSGGIDVVTYSYHWMDDQRRLIMRWDNAEHYPLLPGFPYHIHDGDEKNVQPSEPMSLVEVLDHIATRINN